MKGDIDYDPEEDWLDDNKGKAQMEYPDFFDAMFELADMWSESVDAGEYSRLLNLVLDDAKEQERISGMFSK